MPGNVSYPLVGALVGILAILSIQRWREAAPSPRKAHITRLVLLCARITAVSAAAMLLYVAVQGFIHQRDVRSVIGNMFVLLLAALLAAIILAEFIPKQKRD